MGREKGEGEARAKPGNQLVWYIMSGNGFPGYWNDLVKVERW